MSIEKTIDNISENLIKAGHNPKDSEIIFKQILSNGKRSLRLTVNVKDKNDTNTNSPKTEGNKDNK